VKGLRSANLPIDHLIAEIAAYPLASESAFRLAPIALDPRLSDTTRALWRAAERDLLGHFPAFSVDEGLAFRDALWFGDATVGLSSLARWLPRLAQCFLRPLGSDVIAHLPWPTQGGDSALFDISARRCWRWLSFALPPDLLVAALGVGDDVCTLSPVVEGMLAESGFAETHLHVGAGMSFRLLWISALHAIAEPEFTCDAFCGPGASFEEGRSFAEWLIRAAITRFVLASFLSDAARRHNFAAYLSRARNTCLDQSLLFTAIALGEAARDLVDGTSNRNNTLDFCTLKQAYIDITGIRSIALIGDPLTVDSSDPISPVLRGTASENCERLFVREALSYINLEPQDHLFATLFWQVIRIRVLMYRHIVQRPMTPGLQWFIRFYSRIKAMRQKLSFADQVRSSAYTCGLTRGLRSLEIRTSPDNSTDSMRTTVTELHQIATQLSQGLNRVGASDRPALNLELGLVFHFTKDRGAGALKGFAPASWCAGHACPRENASGYRFGDYYLEKRREAVALGSLIWQYPRVLQIVRAVDVCTDELGTPNWVLTPLIKYLRRTSIVAAGQINDARVKPLRITAHAGEDFVHLITGIRSIHQTIEHFGMREGDRLGHGVALGLDPADWARKTARVMMPREDRFFDLVWEWQWHSLRGQSVPGNRIAYLQREISCLSEQVFGIGMTAWEAEQLVTALHSDVHLQSVGFPMGLPMMSQQRPRNDLRGARLLQYLMDSNVFTMGRQMIWVEVEPEIEAMTAIQNGLRAEVGKRGIVVEVNPSSNLLIGDMGDLARHPLWRLRPPRTAGVEIPPVSICIGSDDPVTFASNLRNEFQLVFDSLIAAGLSEEEARQWLERTRATGLESRFTEPEMLRDDDRLFDDYRPSGYVSQPIP
jgi:hypothetical protein